MNGQKPADRKFFLFVSPITKWDIEGKDNQGIN